VRPFVNDFLQKIQKVIEAGQIGAAHYQLSQLYNEPRLTPDEARLVTQWLDELAGTVIYSRQHLIEPAYRVRPGDTLDQIGQTYGVSGALLAKINGLRGTQSLSPGQELKVLRGPFDAVVGLGRYELTLFLQGRYAGRFPIGIGTDRPVPEGTFIVKAKEPDPSMPATAPSALPNWFGRRCMDLRTQDNLAQTGIHGTDSPQNIGRTGGHGAIFLGDRDIDDVFDILTVGSRVVVRR
jgi:LysM repeat protein